MNIDEFGLIINDIYELSSDRDDWRRLLGRIATACDAGSASIAAGNRAHELSILCSVVTPDQIQDYHANWAQHDPTMMALAMSSPGQLLTLEDVGGHAEFSKTDVYNDFWLQTDHSPEHLRTKIHQDQDSWMVFALNARKSDNEIRNSTVDAFNRFMPHLARAAEIQRRLRSAFLQQSAESYSAGAPAIMLVNGEGRTIYHDRKAEDILQTAKGLSVRYGYLEFDIAADTAEFLKLLHSCTSTNTEGKTRGGKMQVAAGRPINLEVIPISRPDTELGLEFVAEAGTIALVMIDDPERRLEDSVTRLRHAFGLTRAEARVALEALTAGSRKELAHRIGVTESTVRTHLTRVYEKTETGGHAQLIQKITARVLGGLGR